VIEGNTIDLEPMRKSGKEYDRSYFDRWYRRPRTRIASEVSRARKIHLAVSAAEYLLERPIRSVLDIGCGEGLWYPLLRRLRPTVRYMGVDPSEYAVRRFGKRRNIRRGDFATLHRMRLPARQDLIVCSDVLQYVQDGDVVRGLRRIERLLRGVAYIEAYTADDEMVGDMEGWHMRARAFRKAGLTSCGLHCYVGRTLAGALLAMERS
jgi:SAM-dependent methyltransferase